MMSLRCWRSRAMWLLLAALCGLHSSEAFTALNVSDFPRPSAATERVCGAGYDVFICDPNRLLATNNRAFERLMLDMRRLRDSTPCLCNGCSPLTGTHRTLVLGVVVAERIYIPPDMVTNRRYYLRQVAKALRLRWAMGRCPGSENDALILYEHASGIMVYSFGYLVSARLGTRCVQRIENYPNLLSFVHRLMMSVHVLRNAARNPCCGNSCLYLNINWYKMLAWVCGGLVLLSALTFVGRRMWSRNLYIRTRPRPSLSSPSPGPFGSRPRCRSGGHRSSSRPRSSSSFPDGDIQLSGTHVLYSTQSPPPYPGSYPTAHGGLMQAPPYTGKPPAYSEVAFGSVGEEPVSDPPPFTAVSPGVVNQVEQQQQQPQPQQQQQQQPQQQSQPAGDETA